MSLSDFTTAAPASSRAGCRASARGAQLADLVLFVVIDLAAAFADARASGSSPSTQPAGRRCRPASPRQRRPRPAPPRLRPRRAACRPRPLRSRRPRRGVRRRARVRLVALCATCRPPMLTVVGFGLVRRRPCSRRSPAGAASLGATGRCLGIWPHFVASLARLPSAWRSLPRHSRTLDGRGPSGGGCGQRNFKGRGIGV